MIAEAPSVSSERFTVMPSTTKAGQHQPLVANRQPLQPGWLAERYVADMMSADEIAEKCGWSSQYVRDRLRDFGIPLRRPGTHSHLRLTLDQRRLESFLQQGLSVTQISLRTGCSTSGVHNLIRRLGLTIPHTVEEPVDVRADPVVAEATTRTQPDQPAATGSCKPAPPERDRGIQHRSDRETAGRVLRRDSSRLDADGITVSRPGWTASTPPPISEKQPRDLYVDQQMSTRQVADVLKCTPARVLAALKRHGFTIDSRWPVIPPLPADAPTMFDLYVTQRLDDATIAQQYDVPTWRVTKNRRELGCAPATRAHAAAIDPAAPAPVELQRLYVDDGRTLEQIAREKHTSTTVVRRWLEVAQIPIQPRTSREHRKQLDPVLVAELYQER